MKAKSRRQRVYEAVLKLGECTVHQIKAEVGRYITATEVALADRRIRKTKAVTDRRKHSGGDPKSRLIFECLRRLVNYGKLRRVRPGVYAPLLPKVFVPEKLA